MSPNNEHLISEINPVQQRLMIVVDFGEPLDKLVMNGSSSKSCIGVTDLQWSIGARYSMDCLISVGRSKVISDHLGPRISDLITCIHFSAIVILICSGCVASFPLHGDIIMRVCCLWQGGG